MLINHNKIEAEAISADCPGLSILKTYTAIALLTIISVITKVGIAVEIKNVIAISIQAIEKLMSIPTTSRIKKY